MHIVKKGLRYDFLGFESKEVPIETRLDILECFVNQGEILLFQYFETKIEHLDKDIKNELIESDFEGYCLGVSKHRYKETKEKVDNEIKELLFSSMLKDKSIISQEINEEEYKNALLSEFCNGKVSLDAHILNKVKEIIFMSFWNEKDKDEEEFIKSRTMFINQNWGAYIDEPDIKGSFEVVWYSPKNRDEIRRVVDNAGSFTCVVLDREKTLEEFKYALILFEGPETHDLAIIEKHHGSFEKDILLKLKQVVLKLVTVSF